MYKIYKTYKQRLEELQQRHNIKINVKLIIVSNIITALLVGIIVSSVQYKILKTKFVLSQNQEEIKKESIVSVTKKSSVSETKTGFEGNNELENISPVLVGKLIKWLYIWQKFMPELSFSSFNRIEQKRLMIDFSERYKISDEEFNLRKKLYIFSPQKMYCLDPFFGRVILSLKSSEIKLDPSGMVVLVNPQNKTFQIIEMYGPSYDYDEAVWVNEEIFVLAGSEIKYLDTQSFVRIPKISIYNLKDKKVISYYSFGIEEDTYQNFIKPQLIKNLSQKVK